MSEHAPVRLGDLNRKQGEQRRVSRPLATGQLWQPPQPSAYVFGLLCEVAEVLAGFLLITMMRRISRRQRDRHAELRGD